MHTQQFFALAVSVLPILLPSCAQADAVAEALANYKTQGAATFDAQAGARRWIENFTDAESGKQINCASCHHQDLRKPGQHIRTLKPIEPMAPAANPQRLTDVKKIEKWFLRNCKGTWARECTPQEKGDFLTYIQSQ